MGSPVRQPGGFQAGVWGTLPGPVNAYDGLEEQPVCDLSCVVIELADSKSALEHTSHLRFTLFRDERQHQIDIAGVQRPARGGHDGPVQ